MRNRLAAYAISKSGVQLSGFTDIGSCVPDIQLYTTWRYARCFYPFEERLCLNPLPMVDELKIQEAWKRAQYTQRRNCKICSPRGILVVQYLRGLSMEIMSVQQLLVFSWYHDHPAIKELAPPSPTNHPANIKS